MGVTVLLLMLFWAGAAAAGASGSAKPGRLTAYTLAAARTVSALRPSLLVGRLRSETDKDRMLSELSSALAYIRNMAVLGRSSDISAEELLAELESVTKLLRPAFGIMRELLQTGEKKKAGTILYTATGENCAKDIGVFLAAWEDVRPGDLAKTIDIYRSALTGARYTRLRRRDEIISDIVYIPVVINCAAVLLNFLYIAYFLEQKELLSLFF